MNTHISISDYVTSSVTFTSSIVPIHVYVIFSSDDLLLCYTFNVVVMSGNRTAKQDHCNVIKM